MTDREYLKIRLNETNMRLRNLNIERQVSVESLNVREKMLVDDRDSLETQIEGGE